MHARPPFPPYDSGKEMTTGSGSESEDSEVHSELSEPENKPS